MAYEQTQDLTKVQAADAQDAEAGLGEGVAPNASLIQLVIISGRSGSGKTVALRALEDLGYYCIDNLPVNFLLELTSTWRP